jgi:uncharacterized membrane protein YbaN (DUF454 family)
VSLLARVIWGIIGSALTIIGLIFCLLPVFPGLPFLFFGILILIAVEIPVLSQRLIKLIDWLEEKTGWEIHEKMQKLSSYFKKLGLKMKEIKRKRRK